MHLGSMGNKHDFIFVGCNVDICYHDCVWTVHQFTDSKETIVSSAEKSPVHFLLIQLRIVSVNSLNRVKKDI